MGQDWQSTIPIIASLMSILVAAQSINKNFRDTGIFKSISSLLMILVPIVFIQQIIIITQNIYNSVITICSCFLIVYMLMLFLHYKNIFSYDPNSNQLSLKRTFNYKTNLLIAAILLSYFFHNYNEELMNASSEFYTSLRSYLINISMYNYLYDNYTATIYNLFLFIQMVMLLISVIVYILAVSEMVSTEENSVEKIETKYAFASLILACPLTYKAIIYIFSLFG